MLLPGASYYGDDASDAYATTDGSLDIGLGDGSFFSFARGLNTEMLCMAVALVLVVGLGACVVLVFLLAALDAVGLATDAVDVVTLVLVILLMVLAYCCYRMMDEEGYEAGMAGYSSSWSKQESTKGTPEEPGAAGLHNLGNTCYMNSTLQCLSHIPELTQLFAHGEFEKCINAENPLGTKGEVARAYAQLMADMWGGEYTAVAPTPFKAVIDKHAPQFKGYQQHDSQELLGMVLDKLHEDTNLGLKTPGGTGAGAAVHAAQARVTSLERAGAAAGDVQLEAAKAWLSHLQRNESLVSALFQGQAMSRLACTNADCGHVATSFDTFMYLPLSLPPEYGSYTVDMVLFNDRGRFHMKSYTLRMLKSANITDLKRAARAAQLVHKTTQMRIAVVYGGKPNKLTNTTSLKHMGSARLFMYLRPAGTVAMLPIIHRRARRIPRAQTYGYYADDSDDAPDEVVTVTGTGVPFIMPLSATTTTAEVHATALRWAASSCSVDFDELGYTPRIGVCDQYGSACYRRHDRCRACELVPSDTLATVRRQNDDGSVTTEAAFPAVCIDWGTSAEDPEAVHIPPLPSDVNLQPITTEGKIEEEKSDVVDPDADSHYGTTEVTLARCLDKFYKPETLGTANRWKCPECKNHVAATKSMALWRLPDVVVIVLKRFNFQGANNYSSKLETLVEFPIKGLDLTRWVAGPQGLDDSMLYDLFAVSNHTGTLGGGHYTAMCRSFLTGVWYSFNDSHVNVIGGSAEAQTDEQLRRSLHTKAAYVLMYHRRGARPDPAAFNFVQPVAGADKAEGTEASAGAAVGAGASSVVTDASSVTAGGAPPDGSVETTSDSDSEAGSDGRPPPPPGPRPTTPEFPEVPSPAIDEAIYGEIGGTGLRDRR